MRIFIILLVLEFSSINQVVAESDVSGTEQRLDKISQIIVEIEKKLEKHQQNHDVVNKEMINLEKQIGHLHHEIKSTSQKIHASEAEFQRLEQENERLSQKLKRHNKQFREQIRLAYSSGFQSKWKLLLSQHSLQHAGRNMAIYDFVHKARAEQVQSLLQLLGTVEKNQVARRKQHDKLQKLLKKQSDAQKSLKEIRTEKQDIQTRLAKKIDRATTELADEKDKQQQLKKLLQQLKAKQPIGLFAEQKGSLSWPSTGSLSRRFGDPRQDTAGTAWNGVLIRANKGDDVKAIYSGTVVFADWFDHYGWLIIIDHGNDYMSLYAHAEGLYKDVNEKVNEGDIIAMVGDSGDVDQASLYFEIRRQGVPVNPAGWCVTPKMAYSP